MILTACENFPTLTFDLSDEFTFAINKSGLQYEGSKTVDPTSNPKFEKYKAKLNEITIDRVTYTVTGFEGKSTQTASMSFVITDGNGANSTNLGSYSNVNLQSINDKEQDMTLNPSASVALSGFMLAAPNKFNVNYSGNTNESPVKFNVKIKFYYKVKARVVGKN